MFESEFVIIIEGLARYFSCCNQFLIVVSIYDEYYLSVLYISANVIGKIGQTVAAASVLLLEALLLMKRNGSSLLFISFVFDTTIGCLIVIHCHFKRVFNGMNNLPD